MKFLLFSVLLFVLSALAYQCPTSCNADPNCQCASTSGPSGIPTSDLPQFITLTFDDAITPPMWPLLQQLLFNTTIRDNRGCKPRSTYYTSTIYTNFHYAQQLYAAGHDVAIHTVTHTTGAQTTSQTWIQELHKARTIVSSMGVIPLDEIIGFRAPQLAFNNEMYATLLNEGYQYDSSWPDEWNRGGTSASKGLNWPFTFDFGTPMESDTGAPMGDSAFPGLWEIPMNTLANADRSPFSTMDPPATGSELLELFKRNFNWSYNGNRSPFGLFYHASWLMADSTRLATLQEFLSWAVAQPNVFFVSSKQLINYMKNPIPASQITNTGALFCPADITTPTAEICNGIDDNMDGQIDEGVTKFCNYGNYNFYTCGNCPSKYPDLTSNLQGYTTSCGNGLCQSDIYENCLTCAQDCGECSTTGLAAAALPSTTGRSSEGCTAACGGFVCQNGVSTVTVSSSWEGGMCGDITVRNTGSATSSAWTILLSSDKSYTMGSAWGSQESSSCGTQYKFSTTTAWNHAIGAGQTVSVGFCASYSGVAPQMTAIVQFDF